MTPTMVPGETQWRRVRHSRIKIVGTWRSLVAYLNGVQVVASSNLAVPTNLPIRTLSIRRTEAAPHSSGLLCLVASLPKDADTSRHLRMGIRPLEGFLPAGFPSMAPGAEDVDDPQTDPNGRLRRAGFRR